MTADSEVSQFRPKTLADNLQDVLRADLFAGVYGPGQKLSIRRIADEQGVSVIPARDALRGLVAEGVLEFKDSRTIVVPTPDASRLRDIRFARVALEAELANRAFPALTELDLIALRQIDEKLDRSIETNDIRNYVEGNYAFHFYIYNRAESRVMQRLVESLWLQYAPSMRKVCTLCGATGIAHDYHRSAMAALEAGDRDGFRDAIAADIEQGMDFIEFPPV